MAAKSKQANKKTSTENKMEDKATKMKELRERIRSDSEELDQANYEAERERFEGLECLNCNTNLGLDMNTINDFMQIRTTSRKLECPSCSMINRVVAKYTEDPTKGTAVINVDMVGFSFRHKKISRLTKEELKKRLELEIDLIDRQKSKKSADIQLIYKMIALLVLDKE